MILIRVEKRTMRDDDHQARPFRRGDPDKGLKTLWGRPPPKDVLDHLPFHEN